MRLAPAPLSSKDSGDGQARGARDLDCSASFKCLDDARNAVVFVAGVTILCRGIASLPALFGAISCNLADA